MNRLIRSSALTWAFGYVLLGLAALGAFALVLWYAWNVTIFADREEVLQDDSQRLTAVFNRDGVTGLNAYINARVGLQIVGERTLLLTDSAHHRLAGNIAAWPQGVPDEPGAGAVMVDLAGKPVHMLLVRTTLPGGYHLLVGRDLAFFKPLERRFVWGLFAAVTFLFVVGVGAAVLMRRQLLSRVEGIRQAVSAIMQGGLIGRLTSRFGEERLMQGGLALIAVGLFVLPESRALAPLIVSMTFLALGMGAMQPSLNSLISRRAGLERQGEILGVAQSVGSLSRVIGPAVAGVLFAGLGRASPFWWGVLLVVAALAVGRRLPRAVPGDP